MELLQLKYFCDAAESENFSFTAKKYGVPPSGISQTIKRLEEELGEKLFVRGANKIFLSEQGKVFYERVKKGLECIENAKTGLIDAGGMVSGEIRILALTNRRIVTKAIERFKEEYKSVNFLINHNIRTDLRDFDLIISDEEDMQGAFDKTLLIEENIVLAIGRENPLAQKRDITLSDLKNQRFITMPEGRSLYRHTKHICSMGGFSANIVIQSDDPFYVRKYVEMGLGIAFVPDFSWQGMFSQKVVLRKIGNFKRNTCIFKTKEKYHSKAAELFSLILLDMIKNANC